MKFQFSPLLLLPFKLTPLPPPPPTTPCGKAWNSRSAGVLGWKTRLRNGILIGCCSSQQDCSLHRKKHQLLRLIIWFLILPLYITTRFRRIDQDFKMNIGFLIPIELRPST